MEIGRVAVTRATAVTLRFDEQAVGVRSGRVGERRV